MLLPLRAPSAPFAARRRTSATSLKHAFDWTSQFVERAGSTGQELWSRNSYGKGTTTSRNRGEPLPGLIATVSEDDFDTDDFMPIGYWLIFVFIVVPLVGAGLRCSGGCS